MRALPELLADPRVAVPVADGDTPFFILDPAAAVEAYRAMQAALPRVRHHYAIKANGHPALLEALAAAGADFDVATTAEIEAVLAAGATPDRILHTHPHVKPRDIEHAIERGIRTFVADSDAQVRKLAHFADAGIGVLARLSYPNPAASIDLSRKFGLDLVEVSGFLDYCADRGVDVVGLSYHVGSQSTDVGFAAEALRRTIALLDEARSRGHELRIVDIGGGFPAAYTGEEPDLETYAAALRPLVEARPDLDFRSEPGRVIAAPSMHLVTSVVAETYRPATADHWVFIDDGLYGGYSNVLTDHVTPQLLPLGVPAGRERVDQTFAGPTCDSIDVVARGVRLPRLTVGDTVVSPMMGAYTLVTATEFNGIPKTRVIVV